MYTTSIFNFEEEKFVNVLLTQARWYHHQLADDLPYQWARMLPLKPWVAPRACDPFVEEGPTGSIVLAFNVGGSV
jgi:hypothetical protein